LPGVDGLFDVSLSEFVVHRDALVKQLKADGDKDSAAAVKALRKPSAVAWAVNRVARQAPREVAALIEAGRDVRAAQARAVQGKDDGGLRSSTQAWRSQVRALGDQAASVVGEQYRDDAAAAFEAASVDDDLAIVLTAGRFVVAPTPSGFGLAGMPEPAERVAKPRQETELVAPEVGKQPQARPVRDTRGIERARAQLDELEKAVEKQLNRLRRAEQRLDQARDAVDTARAAHEDARAERDEAADALRALEG
ncbi:MAG: hypothetical protein QOF21_2451, partial [Actinomycetota bacterium]